jgi:hypothetical protein
LAVALAPGLSSEVSTAVATKEGDEVVQEGSSLPLSGWAARLVTTAAFAEAVALLYSLEVTLSSSPEVAEVVALLSSLEVAVLATPTGVKELSSVDLGSSSVVRVTTVGRIVADVTTVP